MNAGLDFESKILVKQDAADRLREELNRPAWRGELIAVSGVTDCYQPIERRLRITRSLLEVMLEAEQAVGLITKNALVTRDLDLLVPLAERRLVQVNVSLTTLDEQLARRMEPRTATPTARLKAMRALADAGVPVRVMAAPIIPGLNDHELPELLAAAHEAGARSAGTLLLRLPLAVEPIFLAWLEEHYPQKRDRVLGLIRGVRGGELSDSRFGSRMRGEGMYALQIRQTFELFARRLGMDSPLPPVDTRRFRPPRLAGGQLRLF